MINKISDFINVKANSFIRALKKAYPKKKLKWSINSLKPIELLNDSNVAIAILCGNKELYEGIASLFSFYHFSHVKYPLYWFDDGSLSKYNKDIICNKFINSNIIDYNQANSQVIPWLKNNSLHSLVELREKLIFGRRLTDINFFLDSKNVLLIDSDVLFLNNPEILVDILTEASHKGSSKWIYNIDVRESYCTTIDNIKRTTGIDIARSFNAGLFFFKSSKQNLFKLEEINRMGLPIEKIYYWEQTLFALLTTINTGVPLPEDYDVHYRYSKKGEEKYFTAKSRHYCSDSRINFYHDFENYLMSKYE
jgi:hypothetical protein